jgi:hypothetical protein
MTLELFKGEREILEFEIERLRSFLTEHLADYTFPSADVEPLQAYFRKIQFHIQRDLGKSFEELAKSVMLPNWKKIFDADNYIDSGRSISEQHELISKIIDSIEKTGKVDHLPTKMAESINSEFLISEYRKLVLLEELNAERRLMNESIHWIDACLERVRVMYYSVLLVVKIDEVQSLAEKANLIFYEKNTEILESVFSKKEIEFLFNEIEREDIVPEIKPTVTDGLRLLAYCATAVSISDDLMDIEEDLENQKITGITQAQKYGISPHILHGTFIRYLEEYYSEVPQFKRGQMWFRELVLLTHQDFQKCVEMCREVSPYLFTYFFQRK